MNNVTLLTRIADKTGSVGALVSTMGCSMCFPALASLSTALGLGFLSQWESLFLNVLLPFFAWFAFIVNALGYLSHKQKLRTLLGITGPILLLLSYYPWFQYSWSTNVTYFALAMMLTVSLWDIFSPANKRCQPLEQKI